MLHEIPFPRSVMSNTAIREVNGDSWVSRYHCLSSSPTQSNMSATFSSMQEPIKLNFAETASVNYLLPQPYFELSKQCDQTFFSEEDFLPGYPALGCSSPRRHQNMELLEQNILDSNTSFSNLFIQHQQQTVLQRQAHNDEACLKRESQGNLRPQEGNLHQVSEQKPTVNLNTHLPGDDSYKKMQCMAEDLRYENIETRDFQWPPPYASVVNDFPVAACCSTLETLSPPSNHGIGMSPLNSPFPTICTGPPSDLTELKTQEDVSPNVFPPPVSVDDPGMMINSLPEKGKLLEAVVKAGPLLQTLLIAGPLPQWQHPPPPLDSFEIPLFLLPPTSPLMNPLLPP